MMLTFKINKPVDVVFDFLTDMKKFVSIHPVISKIDVISENKYLVHETLRFFLIPISFTYPVSIQHDFNEKKVTILAIVMRLTKIEMNFTLFAGDNLTIVNEAISFKSPLPIKSFMAKIFRKQHTQLFRKMENQK